MAKRVRYVPVTRRRTPESLPPRVPTSQPAPSASQPTTWREELRSLGFFRYEVREFAKLPRNDPGLRQIIESRRRIARRVNQQAGEMEWSAGKRRHEYVKAVHAFYKRKGALVRGGSDEGRPSPWELRRRALGFAGFNPRGFDKQKRGYRGKHDGKGNTKRQRRLRKQALRLEGEQARASEGKVSNATLEDWISTLDRNIRQARNPERRKELTAGRQRLQRVLREQGG
ncbi:MAG: hypothetical protein JRN35_06145 [Nitrososphaerota archaeon]|nr:hypothetical protein [Nitrososphaerota archaeon]